MIFPLANAKKHPKIITFASLSNAEGMLIAASLVPF
jgi:hypothetical protein